MFTILEERKKHGFTLVEIVVVIGIMSVLSAVLIPAVIHYAEESRVQRDESAMAEIVNMTKTIMDSNIEAYDELYSIGQFIADGDKGVYIVWKDMGETEGFVPYVLGERLEDMAPLFYNELFKTLEGPVYMQSGSYQRQYFVVTLQKDDDDELRWVSGDWSETETKNATNGTYTPIDPDVPNNPVTPYIPEDIMEVQPVDPNAGEDGTISQPEDVTQTLPEAICTTRPSDAQSVWNGQPQNLIIPGETSQGTFYYKLSSSNTNLWQSGIPKATDVGTYQVAWYIKGAEGYKDSRVNYTEASISAAKANYTKPKGRDVVYTGNWESLIGELGTATPADKVHMVYSLDKVTWDPNPPARQAVGTYIVYYKLVGSNEVTVDDTIGEVTSHILPWEGQFEMPSAINPTYTGSAQKLLTPGTAPDGCTIYYRSETGAWSTSIPTATNAGNYTVYYKIEGGERYSSVGETAVTCEIKKAEPILGLSSVRTVFSPPTVKTTITINNNSDGALTISSSNNGVAQAKLSDDGKYFILEGYNQGSATITLSVTGTNNFNAASVEHLVEVTIGTITATSTDGKTTYNGQPQDGGAKVLVTTPSKGYSIQYREFGKGSWQSTIPQFTNAGTYTVEYSIAAEGFTAKSGTFTIIIEKAKAEKSQMPSVTGYEWIYNGTEYSPVIVNPNASGGSPDWQLANATVSYSTYDTYSVNTKLTTMPAVTTPGELRLTNFVFKDKTGNYEDVTIDNFLLNSRIDGTSTAMSTLMMKCYTAEGDEVIYYRTQNGVLYLRKTYREGYSMAALDNDPEGNMFLDDDTAGITTIHVETPILPISMKHWFAGMPNLTSVTYNVIDGEAVKIDTRFTTSMSGLFKDSGITTTTAKPMITGIDFSSWDTSAVTDFSEMFAGCSNVQYLDVSKLNTNSATTMASMFSDCSKLEGINLDSLNTSKVTAFDNMFNGSAKIKTLDLRSFAVDNSATMAGMFDGTKKLETVTFGGNFKWSTADGYLPAITSQNVTAADGKWYDITNASAYTPSQLASLVSADSTTKTYSSVPYYWLDIINGMRDGIKSDTLEGLATVDVYINDQLMQTDAIDWYHPYKYGTKYEFKDMSLTSNLGFTGVHNPSYSLSGTLTGPMVSWLKFETIAGEFQYTGGVQTFTAPVDGYYMIEVWGAQGGDSIANSKVVGTGLAGGYSKGNVYLTAGQTIYISIGGKGGAPALYKDSIGGWNGGGNSTHDHGDDEVAGAGGGATSVQLTLRGDGQLYNYKNNQEDVIIVAGGGSGSAWENSSYGGTGGGVEGGTAGPVAANQTSGYDFGIGESAVWGSNWSANYYSNGIPGGGGGWYGGRIQTGSYATAGGGSGYIGGVKNGSMANGIRKGNGLVKIVYSGTEEFSTPTSQSFDFTGAVQEFIVPLSGYYKLEAWGAAGGTGTGNVTPYGKGGYTAGITYLTKGTIIYVYVGEHGIDQFQSTVAFNGGGAAFAYTGTSQPHIGGRGGGATDFRLSGGAWNDSVGLMSRILVAGGGGGAQSSCGTSASAGNGGGLVGVTSYNMGYSWNNTARTEPEWRQRAYATGGTQNSGGVGHNVNDSGGNTTEGAFGVGASSKTCASGGGGGWYGGGSAYTSGGGGGSSYITRYPGCNTTYLDYQGNYTFTNTTIVAGLNEGNGKAKITYMGDNVSSDTVTLTITAESTAVADLGQFDLYVDNALVGKGITSYIGEVPAGTNWSMVNFTSTWQVPNGTTKTWSYLCAERGGLDGVITSSGTVKLKWMYNGDVTDYGILSDGNGVTTNQEVLWTLKNNTLTIWPANGATGVIKDFTIANSAPWSSKASTITTVTSSGTLHTSTYLCKLFNNCTSLTSASLKAFNVSNTQYTDQLFANCKNLSSFGGFSGTAYVQSFSQMFKECTSLSSIDFSSLNAVANADMSNMLLNVSPSKISQVRTPTYWFFASNCGLNFNQTSSWKHETKGTFTTADFLNNIQNPEYAGLWTKVS